MKKLLSLLLCILMLVGALTSCSPPPEFEEIEDRLRELIEASYEVNAIFFGEGLPVYEHVMDPRAVMEVLRGDDGLMTYYYELEDEEYGRVVAYRTTMLNYVYVELEDAPRDGETALYADEEKGVYAYALSGFFHEKDSDTEVSQREDEESGRITYYYELEDEEHGRVVAYRHSYPSYTYVQVTEEKKEAAPVWEDDGLYAYLLADYKETEYEYYYTENDPEDYDYVRTECPYGSISEIKALAESVYSADYLASIYVAQFDGAATGESLGMLTARYMENTNEYGDTRLMKSNTFEAYITDKRIFDFSTAKIVDPKRSNFVTIEIESYYESTPDDRFTAKITMLLQDDGQWYLDSGTY